MRWPAMSKLDDKVEGVSWDAQQSGLGFQRPISLWRTGNSRHSLLTFSANFLLVKRVRAYDCDCCLPYAQMHDIPIFLFDSSF
jgi:hypothetical protein